MEGVFEKDRPAVINTAPGWDRMDEVCCNVLQCVAVCCSVLQCVAECCSVLQCVALRVFTVAGRCCSVLQCVAVCCSVLQVVQLSYIQRLAGIVWMRCVCVYIFYVCISFFVCVCVCVWIRCVFKKDRPPVKNTAPGWDRMDEV